MFSKLEAIEYLVQNERCYNEWACAGMYDAVSEIINSNENEFSEEYLIKLLDKADNF